MNSFKYINLLIIALLCIFTLGCSNDKPMVSQQTSGNGYKIVMSATNSELESGGSLILTATVFDPEGKLVTGDEEYVYFACNVADVEFEDDKCELIKGVATNIMIWEDDSNDESPDPSKLALITASYNGAMAQLDILLVSENF